MRSSQKGQALLPVLILIVIFLSLGALSIESAISSLIIDRYYYDDLIGIYQTESALENGFLRLLRNPNYSGESLQLAESSCTIEVSGVSPKIIIAACNSGRTVRKMQAVVNATDGIMSITDIREIE